MPVYFIYASLGDGEIVTGSIQLLTRSRCVWECDNRRMASEVGKERADIVSETQSPQ